MLLDRDDELETIDRLLEAARAGLSGTLVIRGEPGIGKSALLDYAVRSAADLEVTRVVGVESEMELGFAALHQLMVPLMPRLERLPAPQRVALRSAFGLVEGPPPNRFLIGLAVLTLFAEAGAARPVLCVVDDAQWLDQESAHVLTFVARRLYADRVAMLFATREAGESGWPFGGIASIELDGVGDEQAISLITATVDRPIDEHVARRVVAETGGNPLALVELASELTAEQLAGTSMLPEPLPIGERLEARFLSEVRILPAAAQMLLLLCAAEPALDRAMLRRAADRLSITVEETIDLVAGRFLLVGEEVRFHRSLIRSAVYGAATGAQRRRVHAALAAACHPEHDQDRRAWHRAAAAVGPDETVAGELERSADRARSRGGYAATAALLARAAELTPDRAVRARRLVATAHADLVAGIADKAQARLDEAMPHVGDGRLRAEARRLQGAIHFARGEGERAPSTLLQAAAEFAPFDGRLARDTLLEALEAAHWAGRLSAHGGMLEVAAAARVALHAADAPPTVGDLLLDGFAERLAVGYRAGVPMLHAALEALSAEELPADEGLTWLGLGCEAAGELLEERLFHGLAVRWVGLSRDAGALTTLQVALAVLAGCEVHGGRFLNAETCLAERAEIAAATGNQGILGDIPPQTLLLMAWRGDVAGARSATEVVIRDALERGQGKAVAFAQYAIGVLELGLGNYEAALDSSCRVFEDDPPYLGTYVLPNLIEAAARSGAGDLAGAALARLAERAAASGTELAHGLWVRSGALAAPDAKAEVLYREAIERLFKTRAAPELGRAHLLYGEWLRRRRRRRDARKQLRLAHVMLTSIGAKGFAERARIELLATGEHARKRRDDVPEDLTAQEARVAQLAAGGASNSEIAAKLFISPRTVAYHLRKAFRKLGVDSRTRLAAALNPPPATAEDRPGRMTELGGGRWRSLPESCGRGMDRSQSRDDNDLASPQA